MSAMNPHENRWYVAMTLARAEAMAEHHLRQAGYQTLYLHYAATVRHARREKRVLRPYLPRYVLFGTDGEQGLYAAARAVGVSSIVGTGAGPLEVPDRVVVELRSRGDESGLVDAQVIDDGRRRFAVGSQVRIAGGPLQGFLAEVAIDGGKEVRVWIQMFGGRVEAEFGPTALEPVSPEWLAIDAPRTAPHNLRTPDWPKLKGPS